MGISDRGERDLSEYYVAWYFQANFRVPSGSQGDQLDCKSAYIIYHMLAAAKNESGVVGPAALKKRNESIRVRQAQTASKRSFWIRANRYYYVQLRRLLRHVIEPGKSVLNIRCQTGHLLEALEPFRGVGVEMSDELIGVARDEHPRFHYEKATPENYTPTEIFDYVLFADIGETTDLQAAFGALRPAMGRHSRLVLYGYNALWEPLVQLAEKFGLKVPQPDQNWLSEHDFRVLLQLSGFEFLKTYRAILFPKYIPVLSWLMNRVLAKVPLINRLCFVQVIVARLSPSVLAEKKVPTVSVIIPCKDEKGNVEDAVNRMPELGTFTEIIFCDDRSTDGTADEVRRMQAMYPEKNIRLLEGPGVCKSMNVWTGFRNATGDILMILDADLTVMPEELPYFYNAIATGVAEFVNGSRLVYPIPKAAMKISNMFGNRAFSIVFSYLLGQTVKDTLCGTKVLWRSDWERIVPMLNTWGITDRWGDYELLFGASKLNLKIVDQPVHYQERIYGMTKMTKVFKNGLIMLRMCFHGLIKLRLAF